MSVYCATTIGEESIGFGWGRRISNIAENTVVGWDELDSGGLVGAYGKIGGYYSATAYPSIFVSWCFCQQLEVSKGDFAEVSKGTSKTEVEEAVEEGWE